MDRAWGTRNESAESQVLREVRHGEGEAVPVPGMELRMQTRVSMMKIDTLNPGDEWASGNLGEVQRELSWHLDEIRKHFKAPRVTLLVRNSEDGSRDILMGDDDFSVAVAAINRLVRE